MTRMTPEREATTCATCHRHLPTQYEWDTIEGGEDTDPPGCWEPDGRDCLEVREKRRDEAEAALAALRADLTTARTERDEATATLAALVEKAVAIVEDRLESRCGEIRVAGGCSGYMRPDGLRRCPECPVDLDAADCIRELASEKGGAK